MATIDPDGFMSITDRAKDVIKSGGEWISSIEARERSEGDSAAAICGDCGSAPRLAAVPTSFPRSLTGYRTPHLGRLRTSQLATRRSPRRL